MTVRVPTYPFLFRDKDLLGELEAGKATQSLEVDNLGLRQDHEVFQDFAYELKSSKSPCKKVDILYRLMSLITLYLY